MLAQHEPVVRAGWCHRELMTDDLRVLEVVRPLSGMA